MRQLRANPAGVDLGPLRAGQLPERLHDRGPPRRGRARDSSLDDLDRLALDPRRRPRTSWCSSAVGTSATTTPGCTTPSGSPRGRPRHQLLMHPVDLADRGLADGALVTRRPRRWGRCRVEVQASDDLMPGVVSPAPRLRAPGRGTAHVAHAAEVARRLDQRPHRPRPARRVGQRGAHGSAGHRLRHLSVGPG